MTFLLPAGLAALALAIPIVVLHMLTPRRPATVVSSTLHWKDFRNAITSAEPWQKLRWTLLFILQLLAAILLALALARPALTETTELADHTVFVVDASGSMSAIDGKPDRLAAAVQRAVDLRAEMPQGAAASVVVASSQPAVLLELEEDSQSFVRAVDAIRTTAGDVDYETVFALAEALISADRPTGFVLLSDGDLDEIEQRLAPLGTRFEPVGETDTNRAITDLSVAAGPGGLTARVTVESTGGPDSTQQLRVDVDGITAATRTIAIPKGSLVEETFELPAGSTVAAFLDGTDLLAYDNQRYAAAPAPGTLKVAIHGDAPFFVDHLFSSMPDVELNIAADESPDLEVYMGTPVPPDPQVPFLVFDAPGGAPGINPLGRVNDPIPTLVADDPLMDEIDISRLAIADAQKLSITNGEVLLSAPGAPLLIRSAANGVPFFYVAFTLEQSNLPIDVAFPILGSRMVGELGSAEQATVAINVGDSLPGFDLVNVTDPRGTKVTLTPGSPTPVVDTTGFWTTEHSTGDTTVVAVNAATSESRLAVVKELAGIRAASAPAQTQGSTAVVATSLLPYVIGALAIVLIAELILSRRNVGVSKRQWRWGMAARTVIVVLLVLALVNPALNTASDEVTTVFVVDVSDSLGSGVTEARNWVEAAITEAGANRWAVVEFGEDARVAAQVGTNPYVSGSDVLREATNLARGLRLGESLLDGSTKQRIVVVSDGRANVGDFAAEIERLRVLGLVVETHTIGGQQKSDAAVASIDVPNSVNEGEQFAAVVEILSTVNTEAQVELLSEDTVVASVPATLVPGSNEVTFQVDAAEAGLQHLTARVQMPGDAESRNDTSKTALEVVGPARVLIVEGEEGESDILAAALESKGIIVDISSLGEMPPLEEMALYRSLIFLDVPATEITSAQYDTLDRFVRDLGRGFVVVGGESSFALGDYGDTPLEALLPVDSEAQDAKREASVAEVLLIDTSESMGACHCSEENGEFMDGGGVNKTDISRAAAARAIQALESNDEVGVLAFSGTGKWVIPLQSVPDSGAVSAGLGKLTPFGETRIIPALNQAAQALRESKKELKHIILFTDGFTLEVPQGEEFGGSDPSFGNLADEVALLAEEGITVSVVATGEGAIPSLEEVAIAGNGRFYPGRDLDEIPEIFVKEARIAARSHINEGEFYPVVSSASPAVANLASSPALAGFVATTPKGTADVQLQIGEFSDPLLASWRVGLGRVTTWTSDGGAKWGSLWAAWDGYTDFWSNVVRDTFPLSGSAGQTVDGKVSSERLEISLESAEPWPPGTEPIARIGLPDGTSQEVRLQRRSDLEYGAAIPARQGGTYAIGVSFIGDDGEQVVVSALASRSFAAEYLPGDPDRDLMESLSEATGGRGEIAASQAFDDEGLAEGSRPVKFQTWFLLLAALLWPIDVALRRLRIAPREPAHPRESRRGRQSKPAKPSVARTS